MAAFVPGFEHDLFISYAHEDDPRWVQSFEEELRDELQRRLGLPVAVWQDEANLRAGDNWPAEIQEGIEHSAAFIAIVSPRYQNSQWCARERNEFRRLFSGDDFINSRRFFKIIKTPWPGNKHELFLKEIEQVEFFNDGKSDGMREFTPGSREFKRALRKTADAVEALLSRMRRANQRVHIAWPADECQQEWKRLSDELRSKGFDVQPTGPRDSSFDDSLIREDIEAAVMSIHLLGGSYDAFAEKVALLAADLDRQLMFWLANSTRATADAHQRALIDAIRRGVRPDDPQREWPAGWSLIADVGIQKFIDSVVTKLRPQTQTAARESPVVSPDTPSIYIVHDPTTIEDSRVALELKDQIASREKMNVFVSRADLPTPTELKLWHEKLLGSCDGVLLYRNAAPEDWWKELSQEVMLAERRFERQPIKSRAFLLSNPSSSSQMGAEVKVISYKAPFAITNLEPFLDPLRSRGPA